MPKALNFFAQPLGPHSSSLYIRPVTAARKPLITANMVTSLRLLAIPIVTYLVYKAPFLGYGNSHWWLALVIGTVIGCTDFVDGLLARKYGPTVLGGMLDPLADKVFIALIYLPLMHMGYFPVWAVGLLFIREFLVTSIRSGYEWRGLQLKTSYFGKVKTWVQMQGIFVFVIAALISQTRFRQLLIGMTIAPLIAVGAIYVLKKRISKSFAWGFFFMVLTVLLFWLPENLKTSIDISLWIICGLTWLSGIDYLLGAIPTLRKAGGFHRADLVRVLGAIAIPVSAVLALTNTSTHALPVLVVFSGELAVGGLDNLLSRHQASASWWSYSLRALGCAVLLFACSALPEHATILAYAAMTVSLLGVAHEFYHGRVHYLNDSNWDEELVEA